MWPWAVAAVAVALAVLGLVGVLCLIDAAFTDKELRDTDG